MKRKTIGMIFASSILVAASIAVAPIVMTSCSFGEKASTPLKFQVKEINEEFPASQELLQKTAIEWQTIYSENPDSDNELVKQINNAYSQQLKNIAQFETNGALITNVNITEGESPILSNLKVTLVNKTQRKSVQMTISGLFAMTNVAFNPPSKDTWSFEQINLPSIAEMDPEEISDAAWTNAINSKQSNPIAIPFNLYSITSRNYVQDGKYQLVYKINDQYESQISKDDLAKYKPITVTITPSPYLNKELKEQFVLTPNEVTKYLGEELNTYEKLNSKASTGQGQVEIYKKLVEFVNAQQGIQPLRNCINSTNNDVYNWELQREILTNGCVIKFSSDPNSTTSQVYNYQFKITFPSQTSGSNDDNSPSQTK